LKSGVARRRSDVSGHAGAWAPDGARGDGEEVRAPEHVTELEVYGDVRESADDREGTSE
jgi:hypothetical protein